MQPTNPGAHFGAMEAIMIFLVLIVFAVLAAGFIVGIYLLIKSLSNRPVPYAAPGVTPEALIQSQRKRDLDHLKLLSIFHFVVAGLCLLGIGFLFMHYFFMHAFFDNPELWKSQKHATPPPREFLQMFNWFYIFFGVVTLSASALNLLSGLFLSQRKHRIFSMVIAGLDCMQIPVGTALGIFTIIVLSRDSIRELYAHHEKTRPEV